MSSSMIPTVVDALVILLTAALPTVQVRDGGVLQNEELAGLYIGTDVEDSDWNWQQKWAGLGHVARDEMFDVPCLLFTRTGNSVLKPARDEMFTLLGAIESELRSTPALGIATNTIRAQMTPAQFSQPQTPEGVLCRARFAVNVEARI